jgi:DNA invertase Pin-like site-specific DNA recombinase
MNGNFIAYYRVSTAKQGRSGLGLDAQREAVAAYLNGGHWKLLGEYTETESGKGSNALARRPKLREALDHCKRSRSTLVIAKLDRLARNVHFVSGLIESGVEFVAADMPEATKTMIQIYAVMAEHERDMISRRIKEALAQAKRRGVRLGVTGKVNLRPNIEQRKATADAFAATVAATVTGLKSQGLSTQAIADELNKMGVAAPRGGRWHRTSVTRTWKRISFPTPPENPLHGNGLRA